MYVGDRGRILKRPKRVKRGMSVLELGNYMNRIGAAPEQK